MDWISDPTIWVGLLTLVVLEIVLGIDNLLFIAILADKLPPEQRDRARIIGLSLALFMRLALLASISWIMSLTEPLFTLLGVTFSWRDVILVAGGGFLIVKATIEMHDRLEAPAASATGTQNRASFWPTIAQIIVLDIVFSLDSVITAVGMVDELAVMMAAVVIAVIVMLFASKPLARLVNAHPTLVILCLGFLLMVGFVLVADGFGMHIPKGYLYAAIGFSIAVETFNQLAARNRRRSDASTAARPRIAEAVLRMLGGVPMAAQESGLAPSPAAADALPSEVFAPVETRMVREVLALADRPVQAIMTPRHEVVWIDADARAEEILVLLRDSPHRQFLVSRGSIDAVAGVARKDDIFERCLGGGPLELTKSLRQPVAVGAGASVLDALNLFKAQPIDMALVVDEYGSLQGILTQTDFLEAIAGNLAETGNGDRDWRRLDPDTFQVSGSMAIHDVRERLGFDLLPEGDFNTIAGLVLSRFDKVPAVGDRVAWEHWSFEIVSMDDLRIDQLLVRRHGAPPAAAVTA